MTDPLTACRERWKDAAPLTDDWLATFLQYVTIGLGARFTDSDRLVAEVLRLRAALRNATLRAEMWRVAYYADMQFGRELWLACWMVGVTTAYIYATTDDSDADTPRSTGRRR